MSGKLDLHRFDEIPDPFAGEARAPIRPIDARSITPSPPRARVEAARAVALAAALLFEASWLVAVERRPDLASLSPLRLAVGLLIPFGAAAIALWAAARRGPRGLGEPVARLAIAAAASPTFFTVFTLLAAPGDSHDRAFWRHLAHCAMAAAFLAAGPLALGAWALARAFVAASRWRAAALGMACGALAAATMSVACPIGDALHVLVGHGGVVLVGGLAGAALARWRLRA
jgi:hypothetical protein